MIAMSARSLFLLCVAAAAWAGDPVLRREGGYFVTTLDGSAEIAPRASLSIQSRGPVSVTGESRRDLSYALEVRVKARSEQEARGLLGSFEV